mgnify:CR=1 FL=1
MSEIGSVLAKELGADRVAEDAETLATHRVDYWILAHLRRRQGRLGPPPACVVKPRSTAEVAKTIQLFGLLGPKRMLEVGRGAAFVKGTQEVGGGKR